MTFIVIRPLLVWLAVLTTSHAALYTVVTKSDSGPGSLRQAILDANANGGGTISLSNITGTIGVQNALPRLTANVTISGGSASQTTIICSNCSGLAVLTNSESNSATVNRLTVAATLDNYGSLAVSDSFLLGEFNPFHSALYNSGTASLSRCTFTGVRVSGNADSIENDGTMSLDHCSISNNTSDTGSVLNRGDLTMDYSVVTRHGYFTSGYGGLHNDGGVMVVRNCTISNNVALEGGGIWNSGYLAVTNSLICSNVCTYSSPPAPGGGLYNIGYAFLQNTTVSGNTAKAEGGGIWSYGGLRLLNCTITSNTVSADENSQPGSGGGIKSVRSFQSMNSIIAGNRLATSGDCPTCSADISGFFESLGHNIVLNSNGWFYAGSDRTDLIGVDPMLGPLQDNGGPSLTHALLPGSPAIDNAAPNGAPRDDQRGVPRPIGPGVDIGAFEYEYPVFTLVKVLFKTNMLLQALATPSTSYTLQTSLDFSSWSNLATVTTATNGVLQFTNAINPVALPKLFYRLRYQAP